MQEWKGDKESAAWVKWRRQMRCPECNRKLWTEESREVGSYKQIRKRVCRNPDCGFEDFSEEELLSRKEEK